MGDDKYISEKWNIWSCVHQSWTWFGKESTSMYFDTVRYKSEHTVRYCILLYGTTTTSACKHTVYEAKERKINPDQLVCKDIEYGAREDLEYGAREDLAKCLVKEYSSTVWKDQDRWNFKDSKYIYQERLSEMSQHLSVYQYYCGRATWVMWRKDGGWQIYIIWMKYSVLSSLIMNLARKGLKVLWYCMIPIRRYCTILYNNTVSGTSIHTGRCKHMVDMKERSIETNRFLRRISMEEKNWCVPFEQRTGSVKEQNVPDLI